MSSPDPDFVKEEVEALLALCEEELRALVEIRCEAHGQDVPGPSMSLVLTSLAILEAILAIFEWDPATRNMDQLVPNWIEQRSHLGDDYAQRLWDAYRNGPAHLFALKQKGGLVNVVRWAKGNARPCVDSYRATEFFEVTVNLGREPGPPGHFMMYAAELAKAVLDTVREKHAQLAAPEFQPDRHTPGWMAWRKQLRGSQR